MIETTYQLTVAEIVRTGFRRRALQPRFMAAVLALISTGLAMMALGGSKTYAYAGVLCILFGLAAPLGLYMAVRLTARNLPWLTAPTQLTASESGLTLNTAGHQSQLAWPLIRSCAERSDFLFLYLDNSSTAITIPKRAFSPSQLDQLLRYVHQSKA